MFKHLNSIHNWAFFDGVLIELTDEESKKTNQAIFITSEEILIVGGPVIPALEAFYKPTPSEQPLYRIPRSLLNIASDEAIRERATRYIRAILPILDKWSATKYEAIADATTLILRILEAEGTTFDSERVRRDLIAELPKEETPTTEVPELTKNDVAEVAPTAENTDPSRAFAETSDPICERCGADVPLLYRRNDQWVCLTCRDAEVTRPDIAADVLADHNAAVAAIEANRQATILSVGNCELCKATEVVLYPKRHALNPDISYQVCEDCRDAEPNEDDERDRLNEERDARERTNDEANDRYIAEGDTATGFLPSEERNDDGTN